MNEQTKQKILNAIDNLAFGQVLIDVRGGKVVNVSVQMSLDLHEKVLDKV